MDDSNQTRTLNFAPLIQQVVNSNGIEGYSVDFINQGLSDTGVILLVECWLDKFRDNFKDPIKEGIVF